MLKNLTKAFVWKPETKCIHKTASKQTEEVEERPISYRIHMRTHIQTHASHTRNSTSASTHIYLMQTRRPQALVCLSRINANTKKDNWFVEQSYYIRLRTIRSILLEFCCHDIQCFDARFLIYHTSEQRSFIMYFHSPKGIISDNSNFIAAKRDGTVSNGLSLQLRILRILWADNMRKSLERMQKKVCSFVLFVFGEKNAPMSSNFQFEIPILILKMEFVEMDLSKFGFNSTHHQFKMNKPNPISSKMLV